LVASYVLEGLSNREIAETLEKALATVKVQVATILKKYGVPSRIRLIALHMRALPGHRSDPVRAAAGTGATKAGGGHFSPEGLIGYSRAHLN
jgi:hypothetical protein